LAFFVDERGTTHSTTIEGEHRSAATTTITMSPEENTDDTVKTANITSAAAATAPQQQLSLLRNGIVTIVSIGADAWHPQRRQSILDRIHNALLNASDDDDDDSRHVLATLATSSK
jgi:hypothetical protein